MGTRQAPRDRPCRESSITTDGHNDQRREGKGSKGLTQKDP